MLMVSLVLRRSQTELSITYLESKLNLGTSSPVLSIWGFKYEGSGGGGGGGGSTLVPAVKDLTPCHTSAIKPQGQPDGDLLRPKGGFLKSRDLEIKIPPAACED